jgi:hypothetical protein
VVRQLRQRLPDGRRLPDRAVDEAVLGHRGQCPSRQGRLELGSLRGTDDESERAHAALWLQAEHAADAPEGQVGLRPPFAVDLEAITRP